jgi:sirohydrochlorin cobaltochelatase
MTQGVILFAHGSRDPLWRRPLEAVAQRMRARTPALQVRCAYLELTEPDLPTTAAELAGLGLSAVRIVPMFLGAGRHVREDLPALVADLRLQHPQVHWDLQPPVGEDDRLLDLLADLAAGASSGATPAR